MQRSPTQSQEQSHLGALHEPVNGKDHTASISKNTNIPLHVSIKIAEIFYGTQQMCKNRMMEALRFSLIGLGTDDWMKNTIWAVQSNII
jgi:hypothetical protein